MNHCRDNNVCANQVDKESITSHLGTSMVIKRSNPNPGANTTNEKLKIYTGLDHSGTNLPLLHEITHNVDGLCRETEVDAPSGELLS